jgi:tryptophan-rich sensory protein
MITKQLITILTSFSHLFLSMSYMILNITNLSGKSKTFLHPPNFIFSFVWTTFYIIFGLSNLKILYDHNLSNNLKIKIINQSIIESLLHWLWLFTNSILFINFNYKTISNLILTYIIYFSFIRSYYLKKASLFLHNIYIPYKLWIIYALFLDIFSLYI